MLNTQSSCFLSIPNSRNKPILHAGTVQSISGDKCVIKFDDAFNLSNGVEVTLHADVAGKFSQQNAKVTRVQSDASNTVIELVRTGEVSGCNPKGVLGVSVVAQNISVSIAKDMSFQLAEVGPSGAAVIAQKKLPPGSDVEVTFAVDSLYATGTMRVLSERQLGNGKFGYDLTFTDRKAQIRKSFEAIATAMLRRQSRRFAAVAA